MANAYSVGEIRGAKKFLEFWHTEAGIILGSVGVKDYDYIIKPDGTMELTDIGRSHNMDHGVPRWYNTNVKAPFGTLPGVKEAEVFVNKYASLEISGPDWPRAEKIVEDYAFRRSGGNGTCRCSEEMRDLANSSITESRLQSRAQARRVYVNKLASKYSQRHLMACRRSYFYFQSTQLSRRI